MNTASLDRIIRMLPRRTAHDGMLIRSSSTSIIGAGRKRSAANKLRGLTPRSGHPPAILICGAWNPLWRPELARRHARPCHGEGRDEIPFARADTHPLYG